MLPVAWVWDGHGWENVPSDRQRLGWQFMVHGNSVRMIETERRQEFGGGDAEPGGTRLERTEIHEVLSNERRVRILECLRRDDEWELSALAEEIAAVETGERPPPRNKRQSVYVTLNQTHLPKLDSLGIVDYDSRRKTVALRPDGFEMLTDGGEATVSGLETESGDGTAVDRSDGSSTTWLDWCIAVAGAGLAAAAANHAGLVSFAPVLSEVYTEITLLVLLAVLVGHRIRGEANWFATVRDRLR